MFNLNLGTVTPAPNNNLAWELHRYLTESGYTVRFREVGDDATELRVRGGDRAVIGVVCRGDTVTAWTVADDTEFVNFYGMAGMDVHVTTSLLAAIKQEAGTNQYQRQLAAFRAAAAADDEECYM